MKKNYFFSSVIKKGSIVFFLLSASFLNAQIAAFPWIETFEDNSPTRGNWTQIYEVLTMSWTFVSSPTTGGGGVTAYEGTKFANYPANSHNFDKTKLVSPALDLSGLTSPKISFYYRNPYWNPDQNWLRIFFRVSATDPWVQILEFHSNITTWTSSGDISIPNTAYQIAIECETDYGYSTTVDAFTIKEGTLDVDKNENSSFKFYPNPAENVLHFSSKELVHQVKVYNLLGQKVFESKVNKNQGQLDISSLTRGNYIIQVTAETGTQAFKFVKK